MPIKPSTDLVKQFAHTITTGQDDLDFALRQKKVVVRIPAVTAASMPVELPLLTTDEAITISSVTFIGDADTVANNTDYDTLSVAAGDLVAGALGSAICSADTRAASLNGPAKLVRKSIGSGLSSSVAASQRLCLSVAKAGSGKDLSAGVIEITYKVQ